MSLYDDIMEDLFATVDEIPAGPDLEEQSLLDIAAFGSALQLAVGLLTEAERRWAANSRTALPEWEGHLPNNRKAKR